MPPLRLFSLPRGRAFSLATPMRMASAGNRIVIDIQGGG